MTTLPPSVNDSLENVGTSTSRNPMGNCGYSPYEVCNVLSHERMGLSSTIAAGPRQHSHSQVRFPWDSWPCFTVSVSRLPQPGGPGPHIYIPQEQGGPGYTPRHRFPFRLFLWLAGLRWVDPRANAVSLAIPLSLLAYSLPRERVHRAGAQQSTSPLTPLFRPSGDMSQYLRIAANLCNI
jgi:hypothetical protein